MNNTAGSLRLLGMLGLRETTAHRLDALARHGAQSQETRRRDAMTNRRPPANQGDRDGDDPAGTSAVVPHDDQGPDGGTLDGTTDAALCHGACGQTLAITKFGTHQTKAGYVRDIECRECRDARRATKRDAR